MAKITKYVCDKCEHSQDTDDQMWDIGIVVKTTNYQQRHLFTHQEPKDMKLWCRACVEQLGLLPHKKEEAPPKPIPETLEDKIREIVQEALEG